MCYIILGIFLHVFILCMYIKIINIVEVILVIFDPKRLKDKNFKIFKYVSSNEVVK